MKIDIEPTGEPKEGFEPFFLSGPPLDPGVVEEAHCANYLHRAESVVEFFEELYRVLKVGGKALVIAPYYSSMQAWQDPRTKRGISEGTFLFANKQWREQNKITLPVLADFDFTYGYTMDPAWATRSVEAQTFAVKHYHNVAVEIHVSLTKRE